MKWLVRLIGALVVLALVAVGSLLLMPKDRLARIASDQLSSQLGRKVSITGDITLSFYPIVGVSTGRITIANADWAGDTPMFSAKSATIGLEAMPLLRRDVRIKSLLADSPDILLQQNGDGQANWVFFDAAPDTATSDAPLPSFSIEDLQITNGAIRYEKSGSAPVAYRNVDVALAWPNQAGPADVTLTLRPAGEDVNIAATLAAPLQFLADGSHALSATLKTKSGSASFTGQASLAPKAAGKLTADLASTSGMMRALGLGAVDIPKGAGQTIKLTSTLSLDPNQTLSLNALDASLDAHRFTGNLAVALADKPRIIGQLAAGALDFSALFGGASDAPASDGWSTAPIDASALGVADADITLTAASLNLGTVKFAKTNLHLALDRSRAVFTLRELAGYQGGFSGEFVLNNRSGLSVGGKLFAKGIEAKDLLMDLTGTNRLSGKTDTNLQFLGSGQSIAQIVSSLRGEGALSFGRGVISGIDLDKMMRSGDGTGGTTIFDSLTASYTMNAGILKNKDLLLSLPLLLASGEGRVNLGERSIDYTFIPKLLETENRRGLAIPVQIKGPWASPRISADLEKAIDLNFKEEKKAFEDDVKQKIGEELGVVVKDGESVEEAVKKKVEDEVKKKVEDEILKGLGGLFGKN